MILFTMAWTNWLASRVPVGGRGGGQGSTNEKIRAIKIQFHMFKSWLHGVKYLLCSLRGQA